MRLATPYQTQPHNIKGVGATGPSATDKDQGPITRITRITRITPSPHYPIRNYQHMASPLPLQQVLALRSRIYTLMFGFDCCSTLVGPVKSIWQKITVTSGHPAILPILDLPKYDWICPQLCIEWSQI